MGARGQLGHGLKWNSALFNTVLNNDIQFMGSPSGTGYFSNVGQTQRRGLELGVSGDHGQFRWVTNYTFMDARFESAFAEASGANSSRNAVQPGNRIPGIPQHTFKVRLEYLPVETVKVGMTMLAQTNQYPRGNENNQDALGTIPGFAVFNLDARYRFAPNWEVFGKVDNVFNRTYSTFAQLGTNMFTSTGYPSQLPSVAFGSPTQFRTIATPIGAWVGVTWHFGGDGKKPAAQDND
jgi:outer membrane receptor protein involved in Fe transport